MPEAIVSSATVTWDATLYDLLSSYAALRLHRIAQVVHLRKRAKSLLAAGSPRAAYQAPREHDALGPLDSYLIDYLAHPDLRRSARASALSASLELVREGAVELKQSEPFAPYTCAAKSTPSRRPGRQPMPERRAHGRCRQCHQPLSRAPSPAAPHLEAMLFATAEPLTEASLASECGEADVGALLAELQAAYAGAASI
jgi:hypothetical protein